MHKQFLFINLIKANLKRLRGYIIPILVAVLILLGVCSVSGIVISGHIYKDKSFTTVKLAYYLPDDDDMKYNRLALGMLEEMQSIEEAVTLMQVSTIDEGYKLISDGEVLFFIIVPERFFSGIMDSTNPPLDIVVKDTTSASSHIANELFMSYATYLGIAQAGIYSALDTVRSHGLDSTEISDIQNRVNLIYLDRALNKDGYIEQKDATNEGHLTLLQHYIAVAVMLSLFFMTFIIAPLIKDYNYGIKELIYSNGLNDIHIFVCNFINTSLSLFIAFIPCMLAVSIAFKSSYALGFIVAIPVILFMALIINVINSLSKNTIVNHMTLLAVTLILTYIGGGILPNAMLPQIIQHISTFMPGKYMISAIGHALFGI